VVMCVLVQDVVIFFVGFPFLGRIVVFLFRGRVILVGVGPSTNAGEECGEQNDD